MIGQRQKQLHILLWILGCIALITAAAACAGSGGLQRISGDTANAFDDAWVLEDPVRGDTIFHAPGHVAMPVGQPVVLKNRLPEVMSEDMVLLVQTSFQHFTIKLGDTVFYEFKKDSSHSIGEEPFPGMYLIPLPNAYASSGITLEITSEYASYSGRIGKITYGVRGDVLLQLLKTQGAGLFGGLLLLLLACVMFFVKAGMGAYGRRKYELTYLGLMIMLFSLFMLSGNQFILLKLEGTQGIWIIRLLSMMLLPFFYVLYLYCIVDKKQIRRFLDCSIIILALNFLAAYVIVLLGLLDVVVYSKISIGTSVFVLAFLTFILFSGGIAFDKRDLTYHGISNIVFFIFAAVYYFTSKKAGLSDYSAWVLVAGVSLWCCLMLFQVVERVADTLQGEKLLQVRAVKEYRQQTLFHLKPDAIFGGLHTLLDMMKKQDSAAPRYLVQISNYLRGRMNMLRYGPDTLIPFKEELLHIQGGLELQMHKSAAFSYNMEIKVEEFMVPAFSIEAFVENAMIHGAGTAEHPTLISVKTYETQKEYAVQIIDTGRGFDIDHIKSQGEYGITQTVLRLEQQADAAVDIRSRQDKGTVVTIKLPKAHVSQ